MSATAQIKDLKKRHEELNKALRENIQALFHDACQEILEEFPVIRSFCWTQYSPYFNDGDECVFSVNGDAKINGRDQYDELR